MTPAQVKKACGLLAEIKTIARNELPKGQAMRIYNRCDKVSMTIKKSTKK